MLRQSVIDSFRPETIEHVRRFITGQNVNNDGYMDLIPRIASPAWQAYRAGCREVERERLSGGSLEVCATKRAGLLKVLAAKVEPKLREIEAAHVAQGVK